MKKLLLHFFMNSMFSAVVAEFFKLYLPFDVLCFVCEVINLLACVALKFYRFLFLFCHNSIIYYIFLEPMERIELSASPLPRECSTTELHRQNTPLKRQMWAGRDSNPRRRKPADLQSAPVDHFGTYP